MDERLMGAFNTVTITTSCPGCQRPVVLGVQFKFGDTWQHTYSPGDSVSWGGNDVGKHTDGSVVVDGVADRPCPTCGHDEEWNFYVLITNDRIAQVTPADGTYDFVKAGTHWIALG